MQSQVVAQTGQGYPTTGHWYSQPGQVAPGVTALPPPALVIASPPRRNKVEAFNCELAVKLGICQIVFGVLIIIFNIIAYVIYSYTTNVIFYGIMIILAGSFEVASGKNNTRCWVTTTMVFAILAAIFAVCATITPAIALGSNKADDWIFIIEDEPNAYYHLRYVVNGILLVLAVVECVIAILAAALTCKEGVCCIPQSPGQQQVIISQPPQYGQPITGNQVVHPAQQAMAPVSPAYTYQTANYAPPAYQPAPQPYAPAAAQTEPEPTKIALP